VNNLEPTPPAPVFEKNKERVNVSTAKRIISKAHDLLELDAVKEQPLLHEWTQQSTPTPQTKPQSAPISRTCHADVSEAVTFAQDMDRNTDVLEAADVKTKGGATPATAGAPARSLRATTCAGIAPQPACAGSARAPPPRQFLFNYKMATARLTHSLVPAWALRSRVGLLSVAECCATFC
jgi:hypothetical protein